MQRFTSLDTVADRVWQRLADAASDPGHAYRALTFGTTKESEPHLRTVVLRSAEATDRSLAFHTDRRSQKVKDLAENDRVAWLGWDPQTREQVRLWGSATLHTDDEKARRMWESEEPSSLGHYLRDEAPGTVVKTPDEAAWDPESVVVSEVAAGWPNFAVIRTQITGFEWLHLHPDGHTRARYRYSSADQRFEGVWVTP